MSGGHSNIRIATAVWFSWDELLVAIALMYPKCWSGDDSQAGDGLKQQFFPATYLLQERHKRVGPIFSISRKMNTKPQHLVVSSPVSIYSINPLKLAPQVPKS